MPRFPQKIRPYERGLLKDSDGASSSLDFRPAEVGIGGVPH